MSEAAAAAPPSSRLGTFPRALAVDALKVGPLQFRKVGEQILVTGDDAEYATLSLGDFERFLKGELQKDEPLWKDLQAKGFVKDHTDFQVAARKTLERKLLAWAGPCVHRFDVAGQDGAPMTLKTARAVADWIFAAPSQSLIFELAGGEPLSNWPAVAFLLSYARQRAEREGKALSFTLRTSGEALDEARLRTLLEAKTALRLPFDAAAAQDPAACVWLQRAVAATSGEHEGFAPKPRAFCRVAPEDLGRERAWIDALARLGVEDCEIEYVDGGAASPEQYLSFYRAAFDYLTKLGLKGKKLKEAGALHLLSRILSGRQWAYPDREPLDRLLFDAQGRVQLFDSGPDAPGGEFFQVGSVSDTPYNAVIESIPERAALLASRLEGQPLCGQCAYKPFCVAHPAVSNAAQGTLWGRMPDNDRCRVYMGLFDHLFQRAQEWELREKLFKSWLDDAAGLPPRR